MEVNVMSESEGGSRHYTTGEIALPMIIVAIVILLPVIAGAIYFVGWL